MSDWLTQLDLSGITVFLQDWGSLIGLRLVAAFPERFAGVVLANGGLPTGPVPEEFAALAKEAYKTLPVVKSSGVGCLLSRNVRRRCTRRPRVPLLAQVLRRKPGNPAPWRCDRPCIGNASSLTDGEKEAFNAPYPDASYLAGARRFPSLVPLFHDEPEVAENKAAWEVLKQFDKPFMCAFADDDPVTAGGDKPFIEQGAGLPGCGTPNHQPRGAFPATGPATAVCAGWILDLKKGTRPKKGDRPRLKALNVACPASVPN